MAVGLAVCVCVRSIDFGNAHLIFNLLELYAFDGNLSILMFLYAIFLCDKNEAKAFLTLTIQEEEEEI